MYLSLSSVNHEQMSRKRKIRENVHLTKKLVTHCRIKAVQCDISM